MRRLATFGAFMEEADLLLGGRPDRTASVHSFMARSAALAASSGTWRVPRAFRQNWMPTARLDGATVPDVEAEIERAIAAMAGRVGVARSRGGAMDLRFADVIVAVTKRNGRVRMDPHTVMVPARRRDWRRVAEGGFAIESDHGGIEVVGGDAGLARLAAAARTLPLLCGPGCEGIDELEITMSRGAPMGRTSIFEGWRDLSYDENAERAIVVADAIVDCAMPRLAARGRRGDAIASIRIMTAPDSAALRASGAVRGAARRLEDLAAHLVAHGADPVAVGIVQAEVARLARERGPAITRPEAEIHA